MPYRASARVDSSLVVDEVPRPIAYLLGGVGAIQGAVALVLLVTQHVWIVPAVLVAAGLLLTWLARLLLRSHTKLVTTGDQLTIRTSTGVLTQLELDDVQGVVIEAVPHRRGGETYAVAIRTRSGALHRLGPGSSALRSAHERTAARVIELLRRAGWRASSPPM